MSDAARPSRSFPRPWQIVEHAESFVIQDAKRFPIAYVYFSNDPNRRSTLHRMGRDEARRIAVNIARSPD